MAAQDAELKLKVSLDLAFFRQQLAGLGQAAAGYNMPINVKFDRSTITKELRNLERALGKKKINVELNLLGGLTKDQLEKIQGRLEALSKTKKVEIPVSVKNGATGRDIQDAITGIRQRIAANQQIRQGGGKLRVATSIKPSITNADVSEFKKAVQQKLSGISVKVKAEVERGFAAGPTGAAGLFEYMRSQGLSGGNVPQATEVGRSERLKKALNDLTVKQLQALAKEQGIGGVSKMRKDPLIEKLVAELNQDIAENILGNIKNQLRDVGKGPLKSVLDTFARGLFNMLGMDAASMRQQIAERRALPPVSFPATIPPRSVSIGPSSTGRALPPGAIPSALPGTAFGSQKYLPTDLGAELKQILRGAAFAFVDAIRREVRTTKIGIGASMQAALPAARIAGLLPAGIGREPSRYATGAIGGETREQMMARRTAEAHARSALRGMDVMGGGAGRPPSPYSYAYRSARPTSAIVPYAAGGAMVAAGAGASGSAVPPSGGGGRGGFGGMGGFGGFGRAMGGINLPGAGTIRELGSEFAFATKQVLLFGQAYKMLGFIQAFPGQVGQAVAQLQTFRNTLNTVATSAEDASESNQLILDLVEKYNVPLQSARDGFTKLYASMAPAGFSGEEIRDLFTGITQAAATFGMSADKVDRVNYAFAQMASKGQVMSEELKGQLGDVLPGAMAIFAEAAGFEGPKAIQDFSAALEDGVYKGEAMNVLLKNVGIVMKQEFGPGAEGAARTFQGVINRMQNSMQLLYESFEPVAVGFLNSVVMPLTDGIKQVSDGFTAFFTGAAARTTGGGLLAQELNSLRPAFEGIRQNVSELINQFGQFARAGLELGKVLLQIAGNPFVGYVLRVYANVLVLTTAIQLLNLRALVPMIANLARSAYALIAFTAQCVRAGQSLQVMGLMARTAGITLRTFFASTGVGLVLAGIGMLIERIMTLNQKMDETRQKAAAAGNAIRMMSGTEALAAERTYTGYAKSLEGLNKQLQEGQLKGKAWIAVNRQQAEALKAAGVIPSEVRGQAQVQPSRIGGAYQRLVQLQGEAAYRKRQLDFEDQQAQQAAVLAPIPEVAAEEKAKGKKGKEMGEYDRSQLNFIQQQFELEKQSLDKRLQGELISQTEYDIALAELKLETEKLRIAEEYRLAVEKTNKDNLSAADKALKLKDLEIIKNNELAIAENDRNIAVGAARQKIIAPILSEIENETFAIEKQTAQANALKQGRVELSAAQEAELSVKERYLSLSQDERDLAKGELDILRQVREQRLRNAEAIKLQLSLQQKMNETRMIGGGLRAGFFGQAAGAFEGAMVESGGNVDYATQMANIETVAMQLRSVFEGLQSAIGGVSGAFANMLTEGVTNMITGTATAKEVFASFLKSVGQALSQAASQMIATYIAIGIAKLFAGFGGGGGGGKGLDTSGFKQYPILEGAGFANGGIAPGGFQAFADGGIVSGPTLGLVGEGKYNEAIVPLPNGRSIPVQLTGQRSARDVMSRNAQATAQASPINLSFETTKIGNVEYVSRDQLEAAMAETRRAAISGGAARGMNMTLDRIQQSPSVRSRIGIR